MGVPLTRSHGGVPQRWVNPPTVSHGVRSEAYPPLGALKFESVARDRRVRVLSLGTATAGLLTWDSLAWDSQARSWMCRCVGRLGWRAVSRGGLLTRRAAELGQAGGKQCGGGRGCYAEQRCCLAIGVATEEAQSQASALQLA